MIRPRSTSSRKTMLEKSAVWHMRGQQEGCHCTARAKRQGRGQANLTHIIALSHRHTHINTHWSILMFGTVRHVHAMSVCLGVQFSIEILKWIRHLYSSKQIWKQAIQWLEAFLALILSYSLVCLIQISTFRLVKMMCSSLKGPMEHFWGLAVDPRLVIINRMR